MQKQRFMENPKKIWRPQPLFMFLNDEANFY